MRAKLIEIIMSGTVIDVPKYKIKVSQGSLNDGKSVTVHNKEYSRNSDGSADLEGMGQFEVEKEKAKEWNFKLFDSNFKKK